MGTNYYLYTDVCEHCGRGADRIHIGKSSCGWVFALHVRRDDWEDEIPASLDGWKEAWSSPKATILDEYGNQITPEEMLSVVTDRRWEASGANSREWYRQNSAEPGPNGLARSRVDGSHCVAHGDGTWDLIVGEFS